MAQSRPACADEGQSPKSKVIGNVAHQTGEPEIEMKHDDDDVIQIQFCHHGLGLKGTNVVRAMKPPMWLRVLVGECRNDADMRKDLCAECEHAYAE